jgi:hypothetical protein
MGVGKESGSAKALATGPDVAALLLHCYTQHLTPAQTIELLYDDKALLKAIQGRFEELNGIAARWNSEFAPFFTRSRTAPKSSNLGGYEVQMDEVVQSLWAVSASNEGLGNFSGQILVSTVPSVPPAIADFEGRFRMCNCLGTNTRVRSDSNKKHFGFPNFHQADYGNGLVFGCMLIPEQYWTFEDVPASTLGYPSDALWRIHVVNRYAQLRGFTAALPTFFQTGDADPRLGTVFCHQDAVVTITVSKSDLGNPNSAEARFRAANDYARSHQYSAAFPTYAGDSDTFVQLACFKAGVASHIDVNYTIGTVLGSTYPFDPIFHTVPYRQDSMPPLDANPVPGPRIHVPEPT